jgi:hypothetical protein
MSLESEKGCSALEEEEEEEEGRRDCISFSS